MKESIQFAIMRATLALECLLAARREYKAWSKL